MKEWVVKLKNIKKNDLIKSFFIVLFVIACLFVFINEYEIQYLANGFAKTDRADLSVYYLDVGQATSTLIVLPNNQSMIIDTGSTDSEDEFIESVNLILSHHKIKEIDYLVLTHSDEDHVGGAEILLKQFQVFNVFRPKILSKSKAEIEVSEQYKVVTTNIYSRVISAVYEEPNCEVEFVEDRTFLIGSEIEIKFFSCQKDTYSQTNAYSPFVSISCYSRTFLFTGDATAEREEEFVNMIQDENLEMKVDFLLVSHHGSKYSTTNEFLAATNPKYAFISAGDNYHPTTEVINRLKNQGVEEIYCTKTCGMLAVGLNKNGEFFFCTMSFRVELGFLIVLSACLFFVILNLDFGKVKTNYRTDKFLKSRNFKR